MKTVLGRYPKSLAVASLVFVLSLASGCASSAHEMTRHLLEGNQAALRADYASALSHYEAALREAPNSEPAKRNMGIVLVKVGKYEVARKLLLDILPAYKTDVEVLYFLGEASRGLEDYNTATGYYQRAMRIDPNDLRVIKALAWTWFKLRSYERSLAATEPLLRKYPADLQLKLIVANNYNRLRSFQRTVEILAPLEKAGFKVQSRDSVSADSERALLVSTLADAYLGMNECKRADSLYSDVLKTRPFLASALVGSAKCDMTQQNKARALAKLERATRANPDVPEAHYLLGKLYEQQDINKSMFYYKRFLLLTQNNRDYTQEAKASRSALAVLEKRNNNATNNSNLNNNLNGNTNSSINNNR